MSRWGSRRSGCERAGRSGGTIRSGCGSSTSARRGGSDERDADASAGAVGARGGGDRGRGGGGDRRGVLELGRAAAGGRRRRWAERRGRVLLELHEGRGAVLAGFEHD